MDYNIQMYAQQMAEKVMEEKQAERVSILLMNSERRNLCLCQCAGVRPQRSVHAAAGYNGTSEKEIQDLTEPDVAECLHQRYVRAGIYL